MTIKQKMTHSVWILFMTFFTLAMLVPIFMMISTSLKSNSEIHSAVFHFFPKDICWENYPDAMHTGSWAIYFRNSIVITSVTVLFALFFNSLAGFAFARLHFKGSNVLFMILLIGLMMPPQVTMLPTFLILVKVPLAGGNNLFGSGGSGLINTLPGVIIPIVSGSFGIFLCKQFYENFPRSLDEAATIDGANKWQLFFLIYVPNSKVILITLTLLKGLAVWNDYLWPLVITSSESMRTVQLALSMFTSEQITAWGPLMAASTLISLPMIILFFFTQKYFVQGVVTTGLK
jgi:multiple sugar transport system permease protein